jgi:flavorubredoxin
METTLRENIDWVGYADWTVRDFHGYETARGTTYNSFLIRDEKTALIDTVREAFGKHLLQNIATLTDPSKVDYVVCNHAEPDHSGALPQVLRALPNAVLVCDKKCVDVLSKHFDISDWKIEVVAGGDTISLGKRSLRFIETPMVHWPESMFTYVPEEKLLFSMDAFGQHYACAQRFDDQVPLGEVLEEAKTYYANIVMPYGRSVSATLEQAATLDIDMIAPSHGVVWRSHAKEIVEAYGNWAAYRVKPKVLVIYDTMWDSTGRMARAIYEGALLGGVDAKLIHVRRWNLTRLAAEVMDAAAVAFGSSTLNRGMMPMAGAALIYLEGLRPGAKASFAFGSYGWGRGGPEAVDKYLKNLRWEVIREPLKAQFRPTPEVLDKCHEAGKMLAGKAKEMAGEQSCGK